MGRLAICGGKRTRETPFPRYNTIGDEEKQAVLRVLDSGVLSRFLGTWSTDFYGGPVVQELEREWERYFRVGSAISMNSATSGLYAAVGACGVGPGDEVIVSPYTMSASATAPIVYGAIPVFADIDPETFCLSPDSIRDRITPLTRAIIVVDLFGHPVDMAEIMEIAEEHDLKVIEDAAQAPGATYKGAYAGTCGDIGVFSLNYHKTIHAGEGGVAVTDDPDLAERLQLIRNHAEAVVKSMGREDLVNMVGFNYRMTEIEAAIAGEQLKKLERLVSGRIRIAEHLTEKLRNIPGITPPVVRPGVRHGFYVYAIRYMESVYGVHRDIFADALAAEGIPIFKGYTEPLYLAPLFQRRIAFGNDGYPFTYPGYEGSVSYTQGICPVTERMHSKELLYTNITHSDLRKEDLDDFLAAVEKVVENIHELG